MNDRVKPPERTRGKHGPSPRASEVRRRGDDKAASPETLSKRTFVAWDGEAVNQYRSGSDGIQKEALFCVLGSSVERPLVGRYLSTVQMLDHLLDVSEHHPRAFHVAFAFDYDVNNILKDIPWPGLVMLKERQRIVWNGYHISHIPHKSFTVRKDKRRIRIDDIFSYFRVRYSSALVQYNIGTEEERAAIEVGKAGRDRFTFADIGNIVRYHALELKTMPLLMDKIREACYAPGAQLYVRQWYGPGALAKYELSKRGVRNHMGLAPDEAQIPIRTAYAGGWFERFKCGMHLGPIYVADLNSAYAYAMQDLPSLRDGEWDHVRGDACRSRTGEFGVFRIRFSGSARRQFDNYMRSCRGVPLPLFQRHSNGNISRPFNTEGWYWGHEARWLAKTQDAEFVESWILKDNGIRPFDWIPDMYNTRLLLKQAGDPAQLALKWALASMYGTTAQRSGWDRRTRSAPRWHQLEWAGAITSHCRSLILSAAMPVAMKSGLVSIDTDGIISTVPFDHLPDRKIGTGLGQWELNEYSGIIYIQNGLYWLRDMSGDWISPKTRGIPQGQISDPQIGIDALRGDGKLRISRRNFVGYGSAIHRRDRGQWRTWEDSVYEINVNRSGARQHVPLVCRPCRTGGGDMSECLHELAMVPTSEQISTPHKLPWLEEDDSASLKERVRHEWERHDINMEWN